MGPDKLISIITVTYNCGHNIEKTLQSVTGQKTNYLEYIIIDGKSTDNTIDIINKYKNSIDILISEPDSGIYDAMNKGLKLANGKYIYHLNSGDELQYLPYKEILELENQNPLIISFSVNVDDKEIFVPKVSSKIKITNTLHHQGNFYLKTDNLFYDLKYKIYSDFDLNQNIYKQARQNILTKNIIVANHRTDGVSNKKGNSHEVYAIIRNNFGYHYVILSYLYNKIRGRYRWIKQILNFLF